MKSRARDGKNISDEVIQQLIVVESTLSSGCGKCEKSRVTSMLDRWFKSNRC